MDYELFDGIPWDAKRSDTRSPKPFRLFRIGENPLTRNGRDCKLTLSAEELKAIAEYHRKKGEKIPIDSRHAFLLAAEKAGVSETEALKAVPSAVAALGFATLELREDGLYAAQIELTPLAEELFRQGALRYWSPVIRGLDGKSPLRITSIAMDNVPALNNLDILAASAETTTQPTGTSRSTPDGSNRKDTIMTKTEQALAKLLGGETLALSDSTDAAVAAKLEALAAELPELRAAKAKVEALELSAETARKKELIDKAVAENRVTNAERSGLMGLDIAWLAAELPKRPRNAVPAGKLPDPPEHGEEEELSDREKALAEKMGLTAEEYLKSKRECSGGKEMRSL